VAEIGVALMNVLYAYHTRPAYMAPKRFSDSQVDCGPFFEDSFVDGRCVSLKTPIGHYDIAEVAARLPAAQKPDLLIVKADASRTNFPSNVKALGCTTVLVVGDTQHMVRPLATMLGYAAAEPFDFVMTDHGRRVLHHFAAAGIANTFWIPGINLTVFETAPASPHLYPLSFIGQYGARHPLRLALIKGLLERGLPLYVRTAPQDLAARIYGESQINLNISLNGDVNLRVFEVAAHGGLLLTDALKPQAGLGDLFKVDREVVTFGDIDDLAAKVRGLLADPGACMMIANRGYSRYLRDHAPEVRLAQFFDILDGRPVPDYLYGDHDRRAPAARQRDRSATAFLRDIGVYEIAQALNRAVSRGGIVAFGDIDADLVASLADLSRLSTCVVVDAADVAARAAAFAVRGVAGQVRIATADEIETLDRTLLLVDGAGLDDPAFRACLEQVVAVVYVQNGSADGVAEAGILAPYGLKPMDRMPGAFISAAAEPVLTELLGQGAA
jgi:hypothetical protein